MTEQPSLPGLDAMAEFFQPDICRTPYNGPLAYKLFFAIFLPHGDALRIAGDANALCLQHGLTGPPLAADRLHITLHVLGDFRGAVPLVVVDAARAAAATVACPPLRIVFDHVLSFTPLNTFVLRCDASSDAAVARLRQTLVPALRRAGLRTAPSLTPHMTVLYHSPQIAEQRIEPIQWTATEFALVLSHTGRNHHQWIDRYPLRDPC